MNTAEAPLPPGKPILLFYREYEADRFVKGDRYLKRWLRPLYHLFHHRQKKSGFAVSFELMRQALAQAGYDVRVNDYRTARRYPTYPVGLVGFPLLLDDWALPNPAVLGPSLYDHPKLRPNLMQDQRFKKYAVLAPWTHDMFAPVYGGACFGWHAGIDTLKWPDLAAGPKSYDFLVYDKIRWHHDELEQSLLNPILAELQRRGLTYRLVRYKMYDHAVYRDLLQGARAMLFICEHETQGLAYQEAMASNLPILAWDAGVWADPLWRKFQAAAPRASSVPFFSSACGETFADLSAFPAVLDRFMARCAGYRPRDYVEAALSLSASARIYAEQYFSLLPARN